MSEQKLRVLFLMCSPNKEGNSAKMAERCLEGMKEEAAKRGVELDVQPYVYLSSKKIEPCHYCQACARRPETPACVIKDDANAVMEQVLDADIVVYAMPIWFWGMPAYVKAFLDRHTMLSEAGFAGMRKEVKEKTPKLTFAVVANCGDTDHETMCKGSFYTLREAFEFMGWRYAGDVSASSGFEKNEKAVKAAIELGHKVVATRLA